MLPVAPQHILFIDIETVPQYRSYESVPENVRALWDKKANMMSSKGDSEKDPSKLYGKAGLYAEFGKIVCISIGCILNNGSRHITSICGNDEADILRRFASIFQKSHPFTYLCAHNGKSFDFPYLCRRLLINGLPIPAILNISGKKPWEINHFDTMELWKFGDFSHYVSLETLAAVFGIPTPKDDMSGADVCSIYYGGGEDGLNRIRTYCEKDVYTLIDVFYRIHGETHEKPESGAVMQGSVS